MHSSKKRQKIKKKKNFLLNFLYLKKKGDNICHLNLGLESQVFFNCTMRA